MPQFVPTGQEEPMSTLCRMAVQTRYEDLPEEVVTYAKQSILDTMAVTVGGSAMGGIPAVVGLVKEKGGKPESILPFYGGRVPASEAAFAIAPMSRAMDLGQVHPEGGHCSEFTLPTLLAATGLKNKVSGKEFIAAFVLGQELLLRIGIAWKTLSQAGPAGRGSGHFIFGAVASAGKLIGLTQDELENAEGIARDMTQPHDMAFISPVTLMLRVHHGFACQDAINACLLTKRGITGPRREVLTGFRGYLGMAKWKTNPEALTDGLGENWEMLKAAMKPYTSCMCTHSAIQGILDQMSKYHFEPRDIASIDIEESTQCLPPVVVPREIKWNPRSEADCQFSLPYTVSVAAFTRDVFLEAYTPQTMARADIRELMTRISAREDAKLPAFASRLHTTLKNGKKFSDDYLHIKGHPQNPFTEQELVDKFKKCVPYAACKLSPAAVDSVIDALLHLEKVENVERALLIPLMPK